mgnify:CR=1 FL=1
MYIRQLVLRSHLHIILNTNARYRHCASLKRSSCSSTLLVFIHPFCDLLLPACHKSSVCSFFLFENICGADNSSPSTTYATILRSNNLISCVHVILKNIRIVFLLFEVTGLCQIKICVRNADCAESLACVFNFCCKCFQ